MAKILDKNECPDITRGIELPIIQNRWRLMVNSRAYYKQQDIFDILTTSVLSCEMDYLNKRINLIFEQGVTGNLHTTINHILSLNTFNLRIDALNGTDDIYHSVYFINCKATNHIINFNFAESGTVKHSVSLKYESLDILKPEQPVENENKMFISFSDI